jgi:hypothetical protein
MRNKLDLGVRLAIVLLSIALLMLFFPYFMLDGIKFWKFKLTIPDYDTLGPFIEGITAPFLSIAAFILLYLTYKSQKQELTDSKEILRQQNATQQKQQFETTFFNLLNLHHTIVNSIDLKISTKHTNQWEGKHWYETEIKHGRDCFLTFYEGFETAYKRQKREDLSDKELTIVKKAYYNFFGKHQYDLGHYFRNLYHIIKFIKKSDIQEKQMYVSLVRAQLSSHELLLLFYNCVSDYGLKFKPLISEYHFLKNMPREEYLLDTSHEQFYDSEAYKS